MGATVTTGDAQGLSAREVEERMRADGLSPSRWGNGPGDRYGWHEHAYHKVLYCLSGSIVFHLDDDEVELEAGDRLDLTPATRHSATVGRSGVECVEASRSR